MNVITINSQRTIGAVLPTAEQGIVKHEPMLFSADIKFAEENGSHLTRRFIHHLTRDTKWYDCIIDSRVHMLMPGMYPCIPGWHHDDVPRSRSDGQPNYVSPEYTAEHCMAIWGDCSRTEFALGTLLMPIPPVGKKIYKEWSPEVERLCSAGYLTREFVPSNTMVYFDWLTWHRGSPTTHLGFRFFIRATRNTHRKVLNEVRMNANTYMPVLEEGW